MAGDFPGLQTRPRYCAGHCAKTLGCEMVCVYAGSENLCSPTTLLPAVNHASNNTTLAPASSTEAPTKPWYPSSLRKIRVVYDSRFEFPLPEDCDCGSTAIHE